MDMYGTVPQQQSENFGKNDLNLLKNTILIFVLSKLASFGANFIDLLLLGTLINYGGVLVLIYGIYSFSNKYEKLSSAKKVIILFLIGIVVDFIANIYLILHPISISEANNQNAQQLIEELKPFVQVINFIVVFLVLYGIVTVITYYYFTEWLNVGFSKPFDKINLFFYAGIIICVAQIVIVIALLMYNSAFTSFIDSGIVTQADVDTLNQADTVSGLGSLLALAAFITEIVAGFKIYNRINDHFTGKYYYELYRRPYPGFPYQTNPYQAPNSYNPYQNYPNQQPNQNQFYQGQPYQNYPNQQPNQNPYYQGQPYQNPPYQNPPYQNPPSQSQLKQDFQNSAEEPINDEQNSPTEMNKDKKIFCKYCQTELEIGANFCFRCGKKLENL